jgi:hypothetical protein
MNMNATQFGRRPNIIACRGLRAQLVGTAAVALGLMAVSGSAHAEAPPAGTIVGNQAIATFNGFDYLAKVITGVTFKDGIETTNPDQIAA